MEEESTNSQWEANLTRFYFWSGEDEWAFSRRLPTAQLAAFDFSTKLHSTTISSISKLTVLTMDQRDPGGMYRRARKEAVELFDEERYEESISACEALLADAK